MKKCLIWGNGADYEIIINQILFEIEKIILRLSALLQKLKI